MESNSRIIYLADDIRASTNGRLRRGLSLFDSFETISSRCIHRQETAGSLFKSFEQSNEEPGTDEDQSMLDGTYERFPIAYLEVRSERDAIQSVRDLEAITGIQIESMTNSTPCCFECTIL